MKKGIFSILGGIGGIFLLISSLFAFYISEENNNFFLPPIPSESPPSLDTNFFNTLMNGNNNLNSSNSFFFSHSNPEPVLNSSPLPSGLGNLEGLNLEVNRNNEHSLSGNRLSLPLSLPSSQLKIDLKLGNALNLPHLSVSAPNIYTILGSLNISPEENHSPETLTLLTSLFPVQVNKEEEGEEADSAEESEVGKEKRREELSLQEGREASSEKEISSKKEEESSVSRSPASPQGNNSGINLAKIEAESPHQETDKRVNDFFMQNNSPPLKEREEIKTTEKVEEKLTFTPQPVEVKLGSPLPQQKKENGKPQEEIREEGDLQKETDDNPINPEEIKAEIREREEEALHNIIALSVFGENTKKREQGNNKSFLISEEIATRFAEFLKEKLDNLVEKLKSPFSFKLEREFIFNLLKLPPKKEDN
ncbi:MAG: hypothetical protein NC920_04890 [Candidatus Omnitrophica bacterium]|nr:hypothetical protein [Candidatus Omnitrophota bacterium]MCM8798277.1 hypothetical protein [Candidatus Omnitrophota bacterium]